jgi:hypothetical protein
MSTIVNQFTFARHGCLLASDHWGFQGPSNRRRRDTTFRARRRSFFDAGLPSVTIVGLHHSPPVPSPCGRWRRSILIPSRLRKLLFDLLIEIGSKSKNWKDCEWSKTAKQERRDIESRKAQPSSSATGQSLVWFATFLPLAPQLRSPTSPESHRGLS